MVEEFVHEYTRRYPRSKFELLNIDSREGTDLAKLYDIVSYPGIVALQDDGSFLMLWQGETLPLFDEVAGYANM